MEKLDSIVLGGGCFWCLEALYQQVKGVDSITSGYAGGTLEHPTYEAVLGGRTGHAEVVKLEFNPKEVSLRVLLDIFWALHNPTTPNQQGADIGTQYRSVIFYTSPKQQAIIEESLKETAQKLWQDEIVTEIKPFEVFWPAEQYHQDYFNNYPEQAYCQIVINPKVIKLKQKFAKYLI